MPTIKITKKLKSILKEKEYVGCFMKKYKISIITVTKNSEKFLLQNILSVKSQNYKNLEHIIVDGNSTDNTELVGKQHDAIFIKQNKNPEGACLAAMMVWTTLAALHAFIEGIDLFSIQLI